MAARPHEPPAAAPASAAEAAGLQYVTDAAPGIQRRRCGRGFRYLDAAGRPLGCAETRARIDRLGIPPGWRHVWICERPDGHIQATGRDEKGRKQYVYHPDWERVRNESKFSRMGAFGRALPKIRARCEDDLGARGLVRDKVLATVVMLLDRTLIRVGNDAYARENDSYGLTTLRDQHVAVRGARCTFCFRGKSGKEHCITLVDRRLARLVRACQEIPGQELFQYYTDDESRSAVCSTDVNAYLKEAAGSDFSAKDYRTWGGSVYAAELLAETPVPESERGRKREITRVISAVAKRLGNTPAVCRAYYVHPALAEAWAAGSLREVWRRGLRLKPRPHVEPPERALLYFLERLPA